MTPKWINWRIGFCVIALLTALIIAVFQPNNSGRGGAVLVAFSGFTNGLLGEPMAQFTLSNGMKRDVGFGAANVQTRQPEGWPKGWILTNGPCYKVGPGKTQRFTVPLRNVESAVWRVPVVYAVGGRLDSFMYEAKSWLGLPHVATPYCTNTPEMIGLSNKTVQRTVASRSAQETNRASSAAGSRR